MRREVKERESERERERQSWADPGGKQILGDFSEHGPDSEIGR
jgi:hypothetical protein